MASVVDTFHWLSMSEFVDIFTISQMTPGPIGINAATFVGTKIRRIRRSCGCYPGLRHAVVFSLGIILARIFLKYGDIGPIRGILNGLRPAVVALICVASLSFILLALWNTETLPDDWSAFSLGGLAILILAIAATRRKIGVIKVLIGSGVLGLALGIAGLI